MSQPAVGSGCRVLREAASERLLTCLSLPRSQVTPWLLLLRLAGALLLGPHMYFVGRHRRRAAYRSMMLERHYQVRVEASQAAGLAAHAQPLLHGTR